MKRLSMLIIILAIALWIGGKEPVWEEEVASSKRIRELINELGNDDWEKRESTTEELIRIGESAIEQIKQAISHHDPEVRSRANLIYKTIKWGVTPELRKKIGNLMDNYDKLTNEEKVSIINQLSQQYGFLAAPVYLRILVYDPNETFKERVYNLLQIYLNNSDFVQQLHYFLSKPPDQPAGSSDYWVNRLLGDSYSKNMNSIETIKYYEKAHVIRPTNQTVIETLDSLYLRTRQWDKNISLYENLIKGENNRPDYYLKLGITNYYKGDKDKARNIWGEMIRLPNVKQNEFYQLGTFYENQNELNEAITIYEQGKTRFSEDTSLTYRLAICYKEQTNYEKAIPLFELVLQKLPPQDNRFVLDLLKQLGECYFNKNNIALAKETWWKMINTKQIEPMYFHNLIQVLEGYNLTDEIIKAYQAACDAIPENTSFRIGLAKVYCQNRETKKALETLLDEYSIHPSEFEVIFETFWNISLPGEAAQTAISLIHERLKGNQNEEYIRLRILLGYAFEIQNDKVKALSTFKELLNDINKFSEADYREIGHFFYNVGEYDEAISLYLKMLNFYQQKQFERIEVYENLGNCYYAKGNIDKAKETWFKITSAITDKYPNAYFNQGRIFLTHQMLTEARQTYENALKITEEPNILTGFYQSLIKIASEERNINQALNYYIQATKLISTETNHNRLNDYLIDLYLRNLTPAQQDTSTVNIGEEISKRLQQKLNEVDDIQKMNILAMLTRLYQAQGKIKEAIESLKMSSQLDPNNKDLLYQLALLYEQAKQVDRTEEIYLNLIKEQPDNALPLYLLAKIYQKKDISKAETIIKKTAEMSKHVIKNQNLQWGTYLKQIGVTDIASTELEQVIKKSPQNTIDDANACELLTNLMLDNGQYETAINYIEQERKIVADESVSLFIDLDTIFSKEYHTMTQSQKMDYINSYIAYCQCKSYYQKNEAEKGQMSLKRVIEIYPGNLIVLEELVNRVRTNNFPEADLKKLSRLIIKYYRKKIEATPSASYYYYSLAESYRLLEDKTDESLELIKKALQIEPAVLDYYVTLTELYIRKKDFSSARSLMQALINLKPYQKSLQELKEKIGDK